ncbi:MAG: FecR family protein [bacterium]|nr:FecR family protein [bacterium]
MWSSKQILSGALLLLAVTWTVPAWAIDAVASFGQVSGNVQVIRETRKIPGRTGLILNDQDVVVTASDSRATIIFRDGSEIRLFQETRFVIEKSEEVNTGTRQFFHNFRLKVGSFWGKFIKDKQNTKISTPTATIGIKGTNVSFRQDREKLDVSLSSGLIEVINEDETIDLHPGTRIQGMQRKGTISDKVSKLPFKVNLKPDVDQFKVPDAGRTGEIEFTLQMVHTDSGLNADRSGMVYLSVEIDKIQFPERVQLNSRGYARVTAQVKPFQTADYRNGQVEILAVMDGEEFIDVGAGAAVLTYDVPKKATKTIRIDMNTGRVE